MSALRLPINAHGYKYMPKKLKQTLMLHSITQSEWCRAIKQKNGSSLSLSAGTGIINWDTWPKNTTQWAIKAQTEAFLKSQGVSDIEIARIWDLDEKDGARHGHPVGVHVGQKHIYSDHINLIGEIEMLSPQAKKHFKLFVNPFVEDVTSHDDVFLSADIRYVRESMFAIAKHGGLLAVIGESGSGKSTLRKDLVERINRDSEKIRIIFPRLVDKTRASAGSICEAIIKDMQPEAKLPQSLESKARMVERLLKDSADAGNRHVILFEEAHDLTIDVMKLLKRFYEIEDGFKKLIAIILIGQPELSHKLDEGRYPQAREFIRRCEQAILLPLDNHLAEYVAFKFKRVNIESHLIISDDAYDAIRDRLTDKRAGRSISYVNPLLVNNTLVKAMNLAAEIGEHQITAALISRM
jgi:type II secretory pathway predicted ATPase ExeA